MATSLTGSIKLIANLNDVRTAVTGAASEIGTRNHSFEAAWSILSGTAANLGDRAWSDMRVLTTGATDSLDLATGGNLTDAFGAAVIFAKLRAVLIAADPANTTTIQLARPAGATGVPIFAAISDAMAPLAASGIQLWADPGAGAVVTATTADLLNVINSAGASATYRIVLVGTSA